MLTSAITAIISHKSKAPIATLVLGWIFAGYSTQHLQRLLSARLDSAYWYADHTAGQIRADNEANAALLEALLDALDVREVEVAA